MPAHHTISKSKLHCILVILILFILVFLSLPLFLIYLANDNYKNSTQATANETANDGRPGEYGGGPLAGGGQAFETRLASTRLDIERNSARGTSPVGSALILI